MACQDRVSLYSRSNSSGKIPWLLLLKLLLLWFRDYYHILLLVGRWYPCGSIFGDERLHDATTAIEKKSSRNHWILHQNKIIVRLCVSTLIPSIPWRHEPLHESKQDPQYYRTQRIHSNIWLAIVMDIFMIGMLE